MNIGLTAAKKTPSVSSANTLLNHIFQEAEQQQASDIHFDSSYDSGIIRFRVQGQLRTIFSPPLHLMPMLINCLKTMSGLNIAEKRLPQEGRLVLREGKNAMEARLSIIPTITGEKITMRLFHTGPLITLNDLGLWPAQYDMVQHHLRQSAGLILVAGPTGSGKTTTLYACLEYLKTYQSHLLSIENPVERMVHGVNQTQVNEALGLRFEDLLVSALRHDPDVLMIGEIRDHIAADTAIKAAESGHLVLSSIHAASSYETILRLLHLGIEQHFLASALRLIIHQRLLPSHAPKASGGRLAVFECLTIDHVLKMHLMTQPIKRLSMLFQTTPSLRTFAEQLIQTQKLDPSALEFL